MESRNWKAWVTCPKCKTEPMTLEVKTYFELDEEGNKMITDQLECCYCGFRSKTSDDFNVLQVDKQK